MTLKTPSLQSKQSEIWKIDSIWKKVWLFSLAISSLLSACWNWSPEIVDENVSNHIITRNNTNNVSLWYITVVNNSETPENINWISILSTTSNWSPISTVLEELKMEINWIEYDLHGTLDAHGSFWIEAIIQPWTTNIYFYANTLQALNNGDRVEFSLDTPYDTPNDWILNMTWLNNSFSLHFNTLEILNPWILVKNIPIEDKTVIVDSQDVVAMNFDVVTNNASDINFIVLAISILSSNWGIVDKKDISNVKLYLWNPSDWILLWIKDGTWIIPNSYLGLNTVNFNKFIQNNAAWGEKSYTVTIWFSGDTSKIGTSYTFELVYIDAEDDRRDMVPTNLPIKSWNIITVY